MPNSPFIFGPGAAQSLQPGIQLPGSASGALTVVPAAATSSHTLTMPAANAVGALINDGSGSLSWANAGVPAVATKTANYTLTTTDGIILGNAAGGAFTLTLPTAVGVTGQIYRLLRTDQTLANAITVATTSSQTIGAYGTTVHLATQNEVWQVVSDGANWQVIEHSVPSITASYTLAIGGSTTAPTPGTNTSSAVWNRVGDSIHISYWFSQTVAGSLGSGAYLFPVPAGLTINTSKVTATTANANAAAASVIGTALVNNTNTSGTATSGPGVPVVYDSGNVALFGGQSTASELQQVGSNSFALNNATIDYAFNVIIPISGWEG